MKALKQARTEKINLKLENKTKPQEKLFKPPGSEANGHPMDHQASCFLCFCCTNIPTQI